MSHHPNCSDLKYYIYLIYLNVKATMQDCLIIEALLSFVYYNETHTALKFNESIYRIW